MLSTQNKISNITFVGSGISASFTLLNFLTLINKGPRLKKVLSINIIEKSSEFNTGIPYGTRSGSSTLLITSLRNFLPEPELSEFLVWLNKNKDWLIKEYKNEGGILSKKWLEIHSDAIQNNQWEDLFIPRRFFGHYINQMVEENVAHLTAKKIIEVNYITGEVTNLKKEDEIFNISLNNGNNFISEKVILSVGSLPVNNLWQDKRLIEKDNLIFANTPYYPQLNKTLEKVRLFLKNRGDKTTNVLIIGANASALEMLYKLNDVSNSNDFVPNNFVFLSTQGRAPDAVIDEKRRSEFLPVNLIKLQQENTLNAETIANATFKDISLSDDINLGAASTVETISKAFGGLLNKLTKPELEKFACHFGNEIGKKQRCAGVHYSNTIK